MVLVHIAMVLDGRQMHSHEVWITVLQKDKSLFRGRESHKSSIYSLRHFVLHTVLRSVALKPSRP